jgi:hypothetical protein
LNSGDRYLVVHELRQCAVIRLILNNFLLDLSLTTSKVVSFANRFGGTIKSHYSFFFFFFFLHVYVRGKENFELITFTS